MDMPYWTDFSFSTSQFSYIRKGKDDESETECRWKHQGNEEKVVQSRWPVKGSLGDRRREILSSHILMIFPFPGFNSLLHPTIGKSNRKYNWQASEFTKVPAIITVERFHCDPSLLYTDLCSLTISFFFIYWEIRNRCAKDSLFKPGGK